MLDFPLLCLKANRKTTTTKYQCFPWDLSMESTGHRCSNYLIIPWQFVGRTKSETFSGLHVRKTAPFFVLFWGNFRRIFAHQLGQIPRVPHNENLYIQGSWVLPPRLVRSVGTTHRFLRFIRHGTGRRLSWVHRPGKQMPSAKWRNKTTKKCCDSKKTYDVLGMFACFVHQLMVNCWFWGPVVWDLIRVPSALK